MCINSNNHYSVKPVLSGHSKIDKTKVLKTNGSLMKVKSIAECSKKAFCNSFDLHQAIISLMKPMFGLLFEWPLKIGFTVHVFGGYINFAPYVMQLKNRQ